MNNRAILQEAMIRNQSPSGRQASSCVDSLRCSRGKELRTVGRPLPSELELCRLVRLTCRVQLSCSPSEDAARDPLRLRTLQRRHEGAVPGGGQEGQLSDVRAAASHSHAIAEHDGPGQASSLGRYAPKGGAPYPFSGIVTSTTLASRVETRSSGATCRFTPGAPPPIATFGDAITDASTMTGHARVEPKGVIVYRT